MTNPAKIAATLTEVEKERLTGWIEWFFIQGAVSAAYNVISTGLQKQGLLKADWTLTDLGRSVRDHLLAEQAKPEPPNLFTPEEEAEMVDRIKNSYYLEPNPPAPKPAREFRVGDMVRHVTRDDWGLGTVLETGYLDTVLCKWLGDGNFSYECIVPISDLIHAPDPATETFFEPDYVTPVGEPVETDNPRAFPSGAIDDRYGGMTLRDWFAGQALAGIGDWAPNNPDGIATSSDPRVMRVKYCYEMADAMLAERVKV